MKRHLIDWTRVFTSVCWIVSLKSHLRAAFFSSGPFCQKRLTFYILQKWPLEWRLNGKSTFTKTQKKPLNRTHPCKQCHQTVFIQIWYRFDTEFWKCWYDRHIINNHIFMIKPHCFCRLFAQTVPLFTTRELCQLIFIHM